VQFGHRGANIGKLVEESVMCWGHPGGGQARRDLIKGRLAKSCSAASWTIAVSILRARAGKSNRLAPKRVKRTMVGHGRRRKREKKKKTARIAFLRNGPDVSKVTLKHVLFRVSLGTRAAGHGGLVMPTISCVLLTPPKTLKTMVWGEHRLPVWARRSHFGGF